MVRSRLRRPRAASARGSTLEPGSHSSADHGVAIATGPLAGLAARAVVVIDENDQVVYSQLVNEITEEPDYDAALAALKA